MKVSFSETAYPKSGALVVGVLTGSKLTDAAKRVDKKVGGALTRAVRAARKFSGKKGQWLEVLGPSGVSASRICLVGLGKAADLDALAIESVAGTIVKNLAKKGDDRISVMWEDVKGAALSGPDAAARLGYGAKLASYSFDKYRTKAGEDDDGKATVKELVIMADDPRACGRAHGPLAKVADGVFLTRDLVSEPANIIFPVSLAQECRKLSRLGVKVEVLGAARMKKLGMGALLGVGQGSANEPQLVVMQWSGAGTRKKPLAFVGKGVTFDTGGISLKPAGGMEDMKWDMGGSGTVIGLMKALAGRKAKVNAVGIVGLVENMPSATAQRPGDVVTSLSGQTIEVINTDAEGRLVLADALTYVQTRFKPQLIVDLATLTGAIIISLGHEYAGLFSNDDTLADRLVAAGKAEGEGVWRMPLGKEYDKALDSDIADIRNVSKDRAAGSITAAQFLQRFIEDTPWAHLDIAGMAWGGKDRDTVPKGGTGFGVRLLDRLVADSYEK
jgi:leucyl aminopeptidase